MVRKAGAVILAVAILFSLSSCNIIQRIQKRFDKSSEDISKQELARLVSSAIMDKENVIHQSLNVSLTACRTRFSISTATS